MNDTGKVMPGDAFSPPPARIWNSMIDAGKEHTEKQHSTKTPIATSPRSTDVIKVKNDSGESRRAGEVLEISGAALTNITDEHRWLIGVEPAGGYFGITGHPSLDGEVADLQVSGNVMAIVNVTSSTHTRADVADGSYVLESSDSGPLEILYAPDATGEQSCVVRFSHVNTRYMAVLIADLSADPGIYPTGTITAASDQLTTSEDLSAYIDDYTVLVVGAGADGGVLTTTITAATATTATLADDAAADVTGGAITILSVADAWVLETDPVSRQMVQKMVDGVPLTKPVVNRFRHISLDANTLIEIKYMGGEWRPAEADCESSDWEWL